MNVIALGVASNETKGSSVSVTRDAAGSVTTVRTRRCFRK